MGMEAYLKGRMKLSMRLIMTQVSLPLRTAVSLCFGNRRQVTQLSVRPALRGLVHVAVE